MRVRSIVALSAALLTLGCAQTEEPAALPSDSPPADAEALGEPESAFDPEPEPGPEQEPEQEPEHEQEPEPEPAGADPHDPDTWDVAADDATIRRAFNNVRTRFIDDGAEAGMAALAALAWPGFTGDELFACRDDDLSYAQLDADQVVFDYRWENLLNDEGWQVDGQVPSDDGWRVYLADSTETVSWYIDGQSGQNSETATAHVAVNDDDNVIWFPAC